MDGLQSRVEDEFLVIPSKTALPVRCVQTNVGITEREYQIWNLPYIPRWLIILMLLSPILLFFVPIIVGKRCKFKAGLSRKMRRRYQFRKIIAVLLIFNPISVMTIGVVTQSELWIVYGVILFLPCFWLGFIILILYSSPLKVIREQDQMFWVKGCGSEFLASLS